MRLSLRTSAAAIALATLLLPVAPAAFAQTRPAAAPAVATVPTAATAPSEDELAATREQLLAFLHMSPTLYHVLESDPSLRADQDYVARANPQLAQFLAQHPEVA